MLIYYTQYDTVLQKATKVNTLWNLFKFVYLYSCFSCYVELCIYTPSADCTSSRPEERLSIPDLKISWSPMDLKGVVFIFGIYSKYWLMGTLNQQVWNQQLGSWIKIVRVSIVGEVPFAILTLVVLQRQSRNRLYKQRLQTKISLPVVFLFRPSCGTAAG